MADDEYRRALKARRGGRQEVKRTRHWRDAGGPSRRGSTMGTTFAVPCSCWLGYRASSGGCALRNESSCQV